MDYRDSVSVKRQGRIEKLYRKGTVISKDWLGTIEQVAKSRGVVLQKLGDTLKSGFKIADPESDVAIWLNLQTVNDYDAFWEEVRGIRQKASKERE